MNASSEIAWRILPRGPCGGQLISSGLAFNYSSCLSDRLQDTSVVDIQLAPLSSQPSSEEQLLLLGQGLTSRPADGGGGGRGRSVSFSLPSSARSAPPASPPS